MTGPDRETMRARLVACGWTETIYGTYQAPATKCYSRPCQIEEAYARIMGRAGTEGGIK